MAIELHDEREAIALQHALDRVEVHVAQDAHHEVRLAGARRRPHLAEQQLRHHLVGAGEVEQPHVLEVDHREARLVPLRDDVLDLGADRGARRAGDEVRVQVAHGATQDVGKVDMRNHRAWTRSGIVIWTCAPGNGDSFSSSGTSSSHGGTIAMRAVPLRMDSLPSHLPT